MQNSVKAFFAFLASGILSEFVFKMSFDTSLTPFLFTLPGLIFGSAFGLIYLHSWRTKMDMISWIVKSTVAYAVAFFIAYVSQFALLAVCWETPNRNCGVFLIVVLYFIAGFIGAYIVAKSLNHNLRIINRNSIIKCAFIGGVIASVCQLLFLLVSNSYLQFIPLFILWQISVGMILVSDINIVPALGISAETESRKSYWMILIAIFALVAAASYLGHSYLENMRAENKINMALYDPATDETLEQITGWIDGQDPNWILVEANSDITQPTGKTLPFTIDLRTQCWFFDASGGQSGSGCLTDDPVRAYHAWGSGDIATLYGRTVDGTMIVKKMDIITKLNPGKDRIIQATSTPQ